MRITLPDDALAGVELTPDDARVDVAIGLYKREQVSFGRAAEIAGITSAAFQSELGRRKIPVNYEVRDLADDLENLRVAEELDASDK